jgi:hypothetical protein
LNGFEGEFVVATFVVDMLLEMSVISFKLLSVLVGIIKGVWFQQFIPAHPRPFKTETTKQIVHLHHEPI